MGKDASMSHETKKREMIEVGWKPGALATDEQGRRVEILSNPWWDSKHRDFRILVRTCPGKETRLVDLRTLSLDSNEEASTG
jgi:hypothetical protein